MEVGLVIWVLDNWLFEWVWGWILFWVVFGIYEWGLVGMEWIFKFYVLEERGF